MYGAAASIESGQAGEMWGAEGTFIGGNLSLSPLQTPT